MLLFWLLACDDDAEDTGLETDERPEDTAEPSDEDEEEEEEEEEEEDTGEPAGDSGDTGDSAAPIDSGDVGEPDEEESPYANCEGFETWDYLLDGPDDYYYASFDGDGHLTDYAKDDGADGTTDLVYAWSYTDGRETGEWEDSDGDGAWDNAIYTSYDADGMLLSRVYDEGANATEDQRLDYVNVDGLLREIWYDEDADGTVDVTYTYGYDALDRVISIEGDRGGDGSVDALYTFTWSTTKEGYEAQLEASDRDEDGEVDYEDYTVFDEEDRVIEYWVDADASGVPEGHGWFEYREDGQEATEAWDVYVAEQLGYAYAITYSYDLDDRRAFDDWEVYDASGTHQGLSRYTWTCKP